MACFNFWKLLCFYPKSNNQFVFSFGSTGSPKNSQSFNWLNLAKLGGFSTACTLKSCAFSTVNTFWYQQTKIGNHKKSRPRLILVSNFWDFGSRPRLLALRSKSGLLLYCGEKMFTRQTCCIKKSQKRNMGRNFDRTKSLKTYQLLQSSQGLRSRKKDIFGGKEKQNVPTYSKRKAPQHSD